MLKLFREEFLIGAVASKVKHNRKFTIITREISNLEYKSNYNHEKYLEEN